ncbi:homeobox-leucine zipper protein HAT5-like isoform X1 [Dioscorea cayenensis subsp. rotundata]|uniref:Homeobox-leucine zipper protein n=2 Tax=Dioscorea cayennensis subsp. rotundata TaxID=55577 RepID=A0AB40CRG6_DIOCR|nr:homeobox-leucine zipper protein HAT5-like isoform X1 [Dioscorea cayenensis subsp. rotundata]
MMFLGDKRGEISWSLMKNQGISPHPFETLLGSVFHESRRPIVNFEDVVCANTTEGAMHRSPFELEETIDEDMDDSLHHPEKKRRLSTDQVQFLEKSFEVDNKLEPDRKIQLANELGLQPRQVAVWFQNRRARWKTKQLEKDLRTLKSSYNSLKLDYDNLLKENQKLNAEVISLTDKLLLKKIGEKTKPETKASNQLQNVNFFLASVPSCKQEDLSSTNTVIFDKDSEAGARTPLFELTDSSNAFEPENSDLSYVEEDEKVKQYSCMKLEDSSGNYDYALEDQGLWLWS